MILEGELRDFSLPDALQLLMQQRKSGVLNLTHGKEQAELFISQGNIIGVRVGGRMPETKIQEMLIESGLVGQKEMADLESMSREMNRPLLSTLTAKGLLSDEQRETWFQMVAEDMVCDLFAWTDGQYAFSTTQKSLPQALGTLRLSTEFTCMEGMRRVDEMPRLRETLTSEHLVFKTTGTAPTEQLGEWEAMVLAAVDGQRSLVQLGRMVPFGSFRLYECVANLWTAGCIDPINSATAQRGESTALIRKSDREQKAALVLGVAMVCLVCAAGVRFLGTWMLRGQISYSVEARAKSAISRKNVSVFLVYEASERGTYPENLNYLARQGMLSVAEAGGPADARLEYEKKGPLDFTLK